MGSGVRWLTHCTCWRDRAGGTGLAPGAAAAAAAPAVVRGPGDAGSSTAPIPVAAAPNYSWIAPDTCFDRHDVPRCQNGQKADLPQVDKFLATRVPRILASPAYWRSGLIFITFDESGNDQDATACCGEKDSLGYDDPLHPNTNKPGLRDPGGGRVGAVALSPFINPGTRTTVDYNHYSLQETG
jgi:hypothetical protein